MMESTFSSSSSSSLALFAKDKIRANEVLIDVPRSMIVSGSGAGSVRQVGDTVMTDIVDGNWYWGEISAVHANDDDTYYDILFEDGDLYENVPSDRLTLDGITCDTARNLQENIRLGEKSHFFVYINYLQKQQPSMPPIPSAWSSAGQDMLRRLLGHNNDDDGDDDNTRNKQLLLPPYTIPRSIQEEWVDNCRGDPNDPIGVQAYGLVKQLAWDDAFIPFHELVRHRNGRWLNAERKTTSSAHVILRAVRDIEPGEPIHVSRNFCEDCLDRHWNYGTAELLRDYGFVEDFPQRWIFQEDLAFDLDEVMIIHENGTATGEGRGRELQIKWIEPVTSEEDVERLQAQLSHLQDLKVMTTFSACHLNAVPQHECDTISRYHDALIVALSHAIVKAGGDLDQTCSAKNVTDFCVAPYVAIRESYDLLQVKPETWRRERPLTCDWHTSFHHDYWDDLETVHSLYQKITFAYNPYMKDTCLDLDDVTQICSSYRPHYHEMAVLHSAKYLEKVERVAFVGGGDSMLLHDILKFPDLQLVVGLELDQQVVRGAFKYFGTQPHWDNEKVEWWFGDATKSLLMLPRDYFGSFDLVLVDLSETVTALSVTDDLDVMEALSLLVKPEGIVVKNEYGYFKELTELFTNTVHFNWNDVPIVCSQSMILGSNHVEFLRGKKYDHGVSYLYDMVDEEKSGIRLVRDFQKNSTASRKHCLRKDERAKEPVRQEHSFGILMIVEAENATIKVLSPTELRNLLAKAIVAEGLTVLSSLLSPANQNVSSVVLIMQEGYVIARHWPGRSYFAFDIHLWSHFDQQRPLKNLLIETVGSRVDGPSSSSYRIVAGGMFGLKSWKDDEKNRGPRMTEECESQNDGVRDTLSAPNYISSVFRESNVLIKEVDYVVLVLCGKKDEQCPIVELYESLPEVHQVIPLWSCHLESREYEVSECELDILKILHQSVSPTQPIRAIIIDASSSYSLAQIVHKIFTRPLNVIRWLDKKNVMVSAPLLNTVDTWRSAFVNKFREDILLDEPAFTASVLFNNAKTSFEVCMMSSGDDLFAQHLAEFSEIIENRTGLVADILSVRGGSYSYDGVIEPSKVFMPNDFNQTAPLKQWFEQEQLGLQSIFQLQADDNLVSALSTKKIRNAFKEALKAECPSFELSNASGIGEGLVMAAFWQGDTAVVLWDGKAHIDINFFTCIEKENVANELVDKFRSHIGGLSVVLHDKQPRGTGRVVNFLHDIRSRNGPWWTQDFQKLNSEHYEVEENDVAGDHDQFAMDDLMANFLYQGKASGLS